MPALLRRTRSLGESSLNPNYAPLAGGLVSRKRYGHRMPPLVYPNGRLGMLACLGGLHNLPAMAIRRRGNVDRVDISGEQFGLRGRVVRDAESCSHLSGAGRIQVHHGIDFGARSHADEFR